MYEVSIIVQIRPDDGRGKCAIGVSKNLQKAPGEKTALVNSLYKALIQALVNLRDQERAAAAEKKRQPNLFPPKV